MSHVTVSIIIPAHNALPFIIETLQALQDQQLESGISLEVSIRDDASTDGTYEASLEYLEKHWTRGPFVISRSEECCGAGKSRNVAVAQSTGAFLCFNDADDISVPTRVAEQLRLWTKTGNDNQLVGSKFVRDPPDATWHYASFLNSLSHEDLKLKSFRELTLIQSTWFMSRRLFTFLNGYVEGILGEDLELFHRILDVPDIALHRCDEPLVIYRHLSGSLSAKTHRKELVRIRAKAFERRVLSRPSWEKFSVWGAGRDGRSFFEALDLEFKKRILEYVDVDSNKINSGFHHSGFIIPVRHVSLVKKPFVVCVAMGRTGGELERNIVATGAQEGVEYFHFI